jgi:hypothetical protein
MTVEMSAEPREQALRERAIRRLKKRRDFHAHLLVYVLFNSFVVGIWLVTSGLGSSGPSSPSPSGGSGSS